MATPYSSTTELGRPRSNYRVLLLVLGSRLEPSVANRTFVSAATRGSRPDHGWISSRRRRVAIIGIALVSAFVATTCSTARASASAMIDPTPLAASLGSSGGTWVAVAMGHLDDPLNTFWQLFFNGGPSSQWALATPPGRSEEH